MRRTCFAKSGPQTVHWRRHKFSARPKPRKGRIHHWLGLQSNNDTETAARIRCKCVELGPSFWGRIFDALQVFPLRGGSDETLTKACAVKQELGEESEPEAPEPLREEMRKAVKTIESRQAEETEMQ